MALHLILVTDELVLCWVLWSAHGSTGVMAEASCGMRALRRGEGGHSLAIFLQWQSSRVVSNEPEPGMEYLSERGCLRCKNPHSECGILSFGPPCKTSPEAPCASPPTAGLRIRSWDRTKREPGSSCWAGGKEEKGLWGLAASWKTLAILASHKYQTLDAVLTSRVLGGWQHSVLLLS